MRMCSKCVCVCVDTAETYCTFYYSIKAEVPRKKCKCNAVHASSCGSMQHRSMIKSCGRICSLWLFSPFKQRPSTQLSRRLWNFTGNQRNTIIDIKAVLWTRWDPRDFPLRLGRQYFKIYTNPGQTASHQAACWGKVNCGGSRSSRS